MSLISASIDIKSLSRFETAQDGESISLLAEDVSGRAVRLTFTTEILSSLVMTLPQMVTSAVQRRRNDPSARLVYTKTRKGASTRWSRGALNERPQPRQHRGAPLWPRHRVTGWRIIKCVMTLSQV